MNSESSLHKQPVLALKGITRTFVQGKAELHVLKGVDLEILPGEIVALIGPSGAGKSTLLHTAGLLEHPDSGEVFLNGVSCGSLSDEARARYRLHCLGFVYQYHNLLPEFSALENVWIPQMIAGDSSKEAKERALWLLSNLGLGDRLAHRPSELSGGEQQRVAIARALANRPQLLLADEPTGNLDPATSQVVFSEFMKLVKETGLSALIATHNVELAGRMDRRVTLRDGRLIHLP